MHPEEDNLAKAKKLKKEAEIRMLLNKKDLTDFELDLIMNDLI